MVSRGELRIMIIITLFLAVMGLAMWLQVNRRLNQLPPKELLDRVHDLETRVDFLILERDEARHGDAPD